MRKLIIALLLCLGLVLTGCGAKESEKNESKAPDVESSEAIEESSEFALEESEAESSEFASEESEAESSEFASEESEAESSESASEESEGESSEEPESAEESNDTALTPAEQSFVEFVESAEGMVAVAYLGSCEGDFAALRDYLGSTGIIEKYPFLSLVDENSFFCGEGLELYAVVLLDESLTLVAEAMEYDYESDSLIVKEELYSGDSIKPIILRGNYSDVFPELRLSLCTTFEVSLEYTPALSMENGKLLVTDDVAAQVFDFSPYELLLPKSQDWVGSWYGEYYKDSWDTTFALLLDIGAGGDFTYSVGYVASEIVDTISGTWTEENGVITFDGASEFYTEYQYTMVFEWRMEGDSLILTHTDGSSFITEEEYASFVFTAKNM